MRLYRFVFMIALIAFLLAGYHALEYCCLHEPATLLSVGEVYSREHGVARHINQKVRDYYVDAQTEFGTVTLGINNVRKPEPGRQIEVVKGPFGPYLYKADVSIRMGLFYLLVGIGAFIGGKKLRELYLAPDDGKQE